MSSTRNSGSIKAEKGDVRTRVVEGVRVLTWKDKRVVSMLSTFHSDDWIMKKRLQSDGSKKYGHKPVVVSDYTINMRAVDIADQHISYYTCSRK